MSKKRSNQKCYVNCANTPNNNPELQLHCFPEYSYELQKK